MKWKLEIRCNGPKNFEINIKDRNKPTDINVRYQKMTKGYENIQHGR